MIIPVWSIHHDWKNYPNPEIFDPERFNGDEKQSRPGVFLPFGDGPRYCLGRFKNAIGTAKNKLNIRGLLPVGKSVLSPP